MIRSLAFNCSRSSIASWHSPASPNVSIWFWLGRSQSSSGSGWEHDIRCTIFCWRMMFYWRMIIPSFKQCCECLSHMLIPWNYCLWCLMLCNLDRWPIKAESVNGDGVCGRRFPACWNQNCPKEAPFRAGSQEILSRCPPGITWDLLPWLQVWSTIQPFSHISGFWVYGLAGSDS